MNQILLFIGLVIILCLTIKPVGKKLPFPTLLIFIALGMLLGVNGPTHIDFSDYALTETVCSTALLFIMFYGGFNTNIDRAKPVAAPAVLLSTLGVVITAGITGVFAHFVLGFDWIGGLLLGSVVASTDAASVFSVLREHSLSLRGGTDSLLEVESGSNDPVAYMLTAVLATLAAGGDINIPALLAKQIILGVGLGLAIGWAAGRLIERAHATAKDAQTIFLFAVAIVAYALPSYLGGNGFLAVYLAGIVLGASDITGKVEMAHFFDTLTEMAEMTIFFLLGLLVTPARLPQMLLPGLALMAFMLFASRPIAVGMLLAPFRTNPRQVALVSWAGLRGAASVVFSLFAVVAGVPGGHDLFDLVFVIAVSSIVVQGSLLPAVAKKLDMIDATGDVRRTFNDYRDEDGMSFVKLKVGAGHPFAGRSLADIGSATDMLVVLVLRDGAHPVLPNGDTVIQEGDLLVMAAPTFEERAEVTLREVTVTPHGRLAGQRLRDVPQGKHPFIVVMLKRDGQTIIPDGNGGADRKLDRGAVRTGGSHVQQGEGRALPPGDGGRHGADRRREVRGGLGGRGQEVGDGAPPAQLHRGAL